MKQFQIFSTQEKETRPKSITKKKENLMLVWFDSFGEQTILLFCDLRLTPNVEQIVSISILSVQLH